MAITKKIVQTFKSKKLPFVTRWHIFWLKMLNPSYDYQLFDDDDIERFLLEEYGQDVWMSFKMLGVGAAKADFFRYAYLFKKGGVYLDIDSRIKVPLSKIITDTDGAILAKEGNRTYYVQWALMFEPGHPILKYTLDVVLRNIKENKYPYDVHKMTGPAAYTEGVALAKIYEPNMIFRELGVDYDQLFQFSYPMAKLFLYGVSRKNHWKNNLMPVLQMG